METIQAWSDLCGARSLRRTPFSNRPLRLKGKPRDKS
eukprot:CAMPEP_0198495412 /NCGR_PEP_ID=MMETSP1462-20131121/5195_1 /TAXON_ID=1333877 /ORGANISM="Brandtodinium nutriculum, Strain RCC3387" /LENGTH=36 /DNA_ID= /DNA_START= /DNA_END= /DNA_ORIENTATION=